VFDPSATLATHSFLRIAASPRATASYKVAAVTSMVCETPSMSQIVTRHERTNIEAKYHIRLLVAMGKLVSSRPGNESEAKITLIAHIATIWARAKESAKNPLQERFSSSGSVAFSTGTIRTKGRLAKGEHRPQLPFQVANYFAHASSRCTLWRMRVLTTMH
jgi:hypothetical protein